MQGKNAKVITISVSLLCFIAVGILLATTSSFRCHITQDSDDSISSCPADYTEDNKCIKHAERITEIHEGYTTIYTCPWTDVISVFAFISLGIVTAYFIFKLIHVLRGKGPHSGFMFAGFVGIFAVVGIIITMALQIFFSHSDCENINAGSDPTERAECTQVEFLFSIVTLSATLLPVTYILIKDYTYFRPFRNRGLLADEEEEEIK